MSHFELRKSAQKYTLTTTLLIIIIPKLRFDHRKTITYQKLVGTFLGLKKRSTVMWYTRYVVWYGLVWKLPAQKFNVGSSEFWLSQSNFLLLASVDLKLGKSSIKSLVPHKEAGGGGYKLLAVEKPPNCSFIGQKLFVVGKRKRWREPPYYYTRVCTWCRALFKLDPPKKVFSFVKF